MLQPNRDSSVVPVNLDLISGPDSNMDCGNGIVDTAEAIFRRLVPPEYEFLPKPPTEEEQFAGYAGGSLEEVSLLPFSVFQSQLGWRRRCTMQVKEPDDAHSLSSFGFKQTVLLAG